MANAAPERLETAWLRFESRSLSSPNGVPTRNPYFWLGNAAGPRSGYNDLPDPAAVTQGARRFDAALAREEVRAVESWRKRPAPGSRSA